jgi:hypothetical protein
MADHEPDQPVLLLLLRILLVPVFCTCHILQFGVLAIHPDPSPVPGAAGQQTRVTRPSSQDIVAVDSTGNILICTRTLVIIRSLDRSGPVSRPGALTADGGVFDHPGALSGQ